MGWLIDVTDVPSAHSGGTVTGDKLPRSGIEFRLEVSGPWRPERRRTLRSGVTGALVERILVFSVPLTIYLVLGCLLVFRYHSWFGDAQARLANAYYVLYSRDPHLAAIGFVWNPGMSLAELPVLLFKPIWPALSTETLGAVIVSALAMAGAGYQMFRFFEELRIARGLRWLLLVLFVANPMILYFGANGMSEALFTFTLVAAARYFAQWLRDSRPRPLVICAFYLGFAYVVRNEAIAAAAFGSLVVLVTTYRRFTGDRMGKRMAALADLVLFIMPFTLAFLGWALTSWIIVGHPFEQFSSAYGTASQIKLLGGPGGSTVSRFWWVLRALLWQVPALPVLVLLAVRSSWRQRDGGTLGVLSILGAVVAFEVVAFTLGQITWALRYLIYAIPFTVMLAACYARPEAFWIPSRQPDRGRWTLVTAGHTHLLRNFTAPVIALALAASCIFATEHTMLYTPYDRPDQQNLVYVLWPHTAKAKASPLRGNWRAVGAEAARLDALHLGRGAIMVDNFNPCIPNLILQSRHPKEFALPNDEDFIQKMGSPYQAGVRYFLVPEPKGLGVADSLNKEWPTLYADGAGLAQLVSSVRMTGCPPFRLYQLTPNSS
jgi:hypothetical protein